MPPAWMATALLTDNGRLDDRYDDVKDLSICPIDRPPGGNPQDRMLLMNHWLQLNMSGILIPRRCDAVTTNSKDSILRHAEACQTTLQKKPSFVLVSTDPDTDTDT